MRIRIRNAERSDYDSLLPLFDQVDLLHRESLPDIFVKPEGKTRELAYFEGLIKQPEVGLFIALENDQIIGFAHAVITDSPPLAFFAMRRYAVVDSVVVKEGHQGKGVGRELMQTVHKWAREQGAESIELNVFEFNQDAISFYQKLGYESLSRKMRKSL